MADNEFPLRPIGFVRSELRDRHDAPRQGSDGAPNAWIEIDPSLLPALQGITKDDQIILITYLHESHRDVLKVHPRGDKNNPMRGVFATRSPDRPNPLGLHRVKVLEIDGCQLLVGPIEAIDGTPIVDIKPVLVESRDW